ncbi:subtilisin-like protease SBT4.14 [Cucumis melo var. makuwa]|uniref:Subtilisin-like protease SBT4.14 n=1 Tax=Cucumis melo var. makuwa TaxID=1194695 RepID=A0A5D3DXG9_CUCMM|nr:subtilisin-like protease SBT4.14 [Cucumis melo var. makuwa]
MSEMPCRRCTVDIDNDNVGRSVLSMPLLVTHQESLSLRVSSDDLPDVAFCIENSVPDVINTYVDVFMRRESPHFLGWNLK